VHIAPAKLDVNANSDVPQGDRYGIPQHSQMLEGRDPEGKYPEDDESQNTNGHAHTMIGGDRHGVAAEEYAEKAGHHI